MQTDPAKASQGQILTLDITTRDVTYEDGQNFLLTLSLPADVKHRIWSRYSIPDVRVNHLAFALVFMHIAVPI